MRHSVLHCWAEQTGTPPTHKHREATLGALVFSTRYFEGAASASRRQTTERGSAKPDPEGHKVKPLHEDAHLR